MSQQESYQQLAFLATGKSEERIGTPKCHPVSEPPLAAGAGRTSADRIPGTSALSVVPGGDAEGNPDQGAQALRDLLRQTRNNPASSVRVKPLLLAVLTSRHRTGLRSTVKAFARRIALPSLHDTP